MADSNSGLQSGREIEGDLDSLLQHLEIREDEEQGIVLEENLEELKAEARWTVLAKVSSPKAFSHAAFIANMKYAWGLAKEASFKAIEENLFVIQFSCLGDWRKVMDEGPWIFRGHAVLLEEYDGVTKPSKVEFKTLSIWARVYDLPTGFRTENIGRQLGNKIGKFLKMDLDEEFSGWRDFLRIRVKLDVEKPLTRVVFISVGAGKREPFRVKYEKLPKFCAVCGLLGHVETECGDGVHDKKALQYGDWLVASPERKGKVKGSRSAGSGDTKGSDSKNSEKAPFQKGYVETKNGSSNQRGSSDLVELRDDARSPLKRDSERLPKLGGSETKRLSAPGDDEMHLSNDLALALIPARDKMEYLENIFELKDGRPLLECSDRSECGKDFVMEMRSQKKLRVEGGMR